MTATLRPVIAGDIPALCQFLHDNMNPDISVDRWRALFSHGWWKTAPCSQPDLGIVAEDAGRIVGFHGHVCAERTINGRTERFLNFTSWYILKEYRKIGLGSRMLEMATADPETTCTVFSLSPKRIDFFKTLGLSVLEEERLLWRKQGAPVDNLELVTDPEKIRYSVDLQDVQILEDHKNMPVIPVIATTLCAQCLLLLSKAVKADGVTYYDVLFRSNPGLFSTRARHIAELLLPDENFVLAADRRFVDGDNAGGEVEVIRSPRFYKSARVQPGDIDLAYSEIPLLGLKLD
ncbi:GNAT family N-acetyltransferase [Pseudodesulfovibrio sediminis]|uniref:N-acetyltransferase domain-containing protein n=1 Tax=Pseudodesulfovibrio sediminis TaxID=2810563 RepID=A0ABN6EU78_9BACT|nr:GNAT family N-acetyltransferase [Pseudodesulfovibrio sediminis]BCS88754.1 hypothetical protein PSDVSF_19960 [Pseudodesulfovibrio sediminis]